MGPIVPIHVYVLAAAMFGTGLVAYIAGFFCGYDQGRKVGHMIGEELERRKWKRRQPGSHLP